MKSMLFAKPTWIGFLSISMSVVYLEISREILRKVVSPCN